MSLQHCLGLIAALLLIAGCGGSESTTSLLQPPQQNDSATVNSLQLRGPLQEKRDNQLTVMGQTVAINSDTRVIGTDFGRLAAGDVLSIIGIRRGGIIHCVEIRVETNQVSHVVVGAPHMNDQGQYTIGNLQLNLPDGLQLTPDGTTEYVLEGLFDSELVSINIDRILGNADGIDGNPINNVETGDRLTLNLDGAATCTATGNTENYRLLSIELTPDFRPITRDVSSEASATPHSDAIVVDSISDQGIGLRFAEQGITGVNFTIGDDQITRYFAALNAGVSRPVIVASVNSSQCSFAYFPANNSGCAIAFSNRGSSSGVFASGSSGGAGGRDGQPGANGQDGVSVSSENGTIRFADNITISNCQVEESNGVPVISVNR